MDRVCSYCSATTNRSPIENCPACGESLNNAKEVATEPFVPTEDEIDGAMESIAPTPDEAPEAFEVPPELAAPIGEPPAPDAEAPSEPEQPAATAAEQAAEETAPAESEAPIAAEPVTADAPPEPAPEGAVEASVAEPAVAQAMPPSEENTPAEEEEDAAAEEKPAPQTRLRCRKCGAFVDPDASPDCPVCFEPTEGAIVVPWTPPPEPEEEKEAAPLEVSATSMPSEVVEAAKRSQERICTWCGAKVIPSATGICPACGDVVPALPRAGEIATAPIPQDPDRPSSSFRRETPLRGDRPSGERKVVPVPAPATAPDARPPAVEVARPTRERPVALPRDPEFQAERPASTGDSLAFRVLLVAFGMAMGAAAMALTDRILDRVLK